MSDYLAELGHFFLFFISFMSIVFGFTFALLLATCLTWYALIPLAICIGGWIMMHRVLGLGHPFKWS